MFYILLAVSAAVSLLHWLMTRSDDAKLFSKIPGPNGYPVVGNAIDIIHERVPIFYKARMWANSYKDIHKMWIYPYRVINIYNPEDIETITSTAKYNEKSFIYSFLKPWLQQGLLLSNGTKWHTRRKILTPAFHFNILRHFTHILEENSWRMVQDLETQLHKKQISLVPIISAYTLNSICETAMGTKLNDFETDFTLRYKKAIHEIGMLLVRRITKIWLYPDFLFNMSPIGRENNKLLKVIKALPQLVINERRKYREEYGDDVIIEGSTADEEIQMTKNKKRMAMLDLLLSAEKDGLIDAKGIQEEVDTFMFEGHDTTAMGLVFTLMLLANHKDIQDKVVEELEGIFHGSDRPASMADLLEMKYLDCCVKESLRLYPPVPFISRKIGEEVQLQNYRVPGGTLCHIHIFDLHRRSDLFPEPLQFRPDRFLPVNCVNRHPYAYIPFSAGPRNCIGQRFAMLEMKSAISAILRTYELLPVTKPADLIFSSDMVLRTQNPIYVRFTKRP